MIKRRIARWRCHRSLLCCQHVDMPNCNGSGETHLLARFVRRFYERI